VKKSPAKKFAVHEEIFAGPTRKAGALHFEDGSVHLWACEGSCEEGAAVRSVQLPEEVARFKRKVERLETPEGAVALWVRFGPDDKFYSLLFVGAGKDSRDDAPVLLLRGWAGQRSNSRTEIEFTRTSKGPRLLVRNTPEQVACGRTAASSTRLLDVARGRFRTVRAPILNKEQREAAKPLAVAPFSSESSDLLPLGRAGDHSAKAPVDADRGAPWSGGFEFVELKGPADQGLSKLILEVAGKRKEAHDIYLSTTASLFRVSIPAGDETQFELTVPAEESSCVALLQPQSPAPITEVMIPAPGSKRRSTVELVQALEASDAAAAPLSLRLRNEEAAQEMASKFGRMSALARRRSMDVAASLPHKAAASFFVVALAKGNSEERLRSLEELRALGKGALSSIEARLAQQIPDGEAELIEALVALSPADAARVLPSLLAVESPVRRLAVRRALSRLMDDEEGVEILSNRLKAVASGKDK
jgi:hypothetical protein